MEGGIQTFRWTGINKEGQRLRGVIQAQDVKSAETELKAMQVEVISISVKQGFSMPFLRKSKIRQKEIILFTRYLSTMLNAGMPILKALDVIARDQDNAVMKSMVVSLRNNISSGASLSDSLRQFPECFNELYCNLTRAGEKSATLDKVLGRLVRYLEKIERIKSKVKTALIYPVTIVFIAIVVSLILLLFVVPQFQSMFSNAGVKLPLFTRIVIHVSDIVRGYWWLLILLIVGGIWGTKILREKNEYFSDKFDSFILRMYIIGPIIKKSIIARFTRTLAITLDAGLPIVDSMKSMINIMGNKRYSKGVVQICDDITNGNQLASSIESTRLFPGMVVQMIAVGEASGALGDMLNNIASYYEDEVDSIADNLTTILEPLIISLLGVIIGCFVIAMYLPIFKLGTTI
ncbi:Type II secretion system protein F [Aquicella siphonis]|uniref:Type II secretion system protein F n=1 Tax=Aquicella siphonis TaxID=254247 RepID=A0A5E4PLD1_9COXI|nr:type II secretion system F family protein [Aquicella siphonis]VVC77072.1 Type II secretion system protein F [Aquicella siphonis]